VVSYLLIGFWYTRPSAIFANLKAFLVNRVGDFGFVLGISGPCCATRGLAGLRDGVFCGMPGKSQRRRFTSAAPWPGRPITFTCICLFIGRHGQVRAGFPVARVAAGFHGRPHADFSALIPCRNHGDRRHLHGGAHGRRCVRGCRRRRCCRWYWSSGATTAVLHGVCSAS